nr:cysteine-rich receptor-like protein kinase 26 [Quercus suber]
MGHSSLLLFFHFVFIHLVIPTAAQYWYCYTTGNYISNSTYRENLKTLLASMIKNTKIDYGFYNFSSGESPDKVYSIAHCSKDVSLGECCSCINVSTYDLLGACPNQKEAIIWANKCSLRYSPRSIFNREEDNPMRGLYNTGNVPDVEGFNNVLLPLLNSLRNSTAAGNSTYNFAMQSVPAPEYQTIYALSECTPDLREWECDSTLLAAAEPPPSPPLPSLHQRNNENGPFERLLLFFYVALIHLVIPTAAQYCYNTGNYTSNSTYRANLNILLASMINNTKINYGFYNFSFGEAPDKVYAIALCRGDTSPSECRSCINRASSDLLKACPNQKEAIIWPDKCSLRYSNRSIFNAMEASPLFAFYNTGDVSDVEAFNNSLLPLLNILRNSTHKFALQSTPAPNIQTIYALLECTHDLSKLECNSACRRFRVLYHNVVMASKEVNL